MISSVFLKLSPVASCSAMLAVAALGFGRAQSTPADRVAPAVAAAPAVPSVAHEALGCCRFSRSSTGGFSRIFVMGRTRFPGLGGALIGEGAMV